MNTYRSLSVSLTAIVSLSPAFVAADESALKERATTKDNIVITANREPSPVRDIGSAFSVVDRPLIEQRQSVFAADLLQDVPGVAVSRTGTYGSQTQVRMRGGEANQVMVMIDGIKANDLAFGDEFNFANLTTYDVERIEVVRGPQSALWGSDSMSGVINIITRKADKPLDAGVFVEAGSFESYNLGGRIGTAGDRGDASLNASYLDTEGTNISRTGDEKDSYNNLTTTLNAGYNLLENFKLDVVARYTDATNEFDDAPTGQPVDADLKTDQKQTYFQARGQLALFEQFWDQQLRMTWVDTDNETFRDSATDRTASGEKLGVYYQTDLNLTRNASGKVTNALILGVDYEDEDWKQDSAFGGPRSANMQNTGLVAEYLTNPVDPLAISLALRYDDNSDFDNVTTWRATTSYTFASTSTRLRASAGTGQKRPTFSERFGTFDDFIGNPNLKPETSQGWDIGVDQPFLDERLTLNLTYFNEKLEDEINGFFFDLAGGGFTAINKEGTSKRKGVEAALDYEITTGLDLFASYTYTDAKEPSAAGGEVNEIRRPRHMAAANLNYQFWRDRANVNLNVSYMGEQLDDDFSTFPAPRVPLAAYTLINLAGEFAASDTITLYGRIDNLFDKDYENALGYASPGIGAFVGARLKFAN